MQKLILVLLLSAVTGCSEKPGSSTVLEPIGRGPHSVGSTSMEVANKHGAIGDEAMHDILLGNTKNQDEAVFLSDILNYPDSAWVVDVPIPDDRELYGPASGQTLPVVTYVTYPSNANAQPSSYAFPYHDAQYGIFEDMLGPDETPSISDSDQRYPLIILAHGSEAHGIFDVAHAHDLASHGYIVAVITYGDNRTAGSNARNDHVALLRPLLTKAVILEKSVELRPTGIISL